jgi:hypothetical protein
MRGGDLVSAVRANDLRILDARGDRYYRGLGLRRIADAGRAIFENLILSRDPFLEDWTLGPELFLSFIRGMHGSLEGVFKAVVVKEKPIVVGFHASDARRVVKGLASSD